MDYKEKVIALLKSNNVTYEQKEKLKEIFPELKESEDEGIRKSIIAILNNYVDNSNTFKPKMIAWLEKQGEQNLANSAKTCKIEPKFNEGDWVFIEDVKGYKNGPFQIKVVDSFGYSFDEYYTIPFMYEELLSKWTIQDAKDGDVLFQDLMGGKTFIYNGVNSNMAILYSFIISNDGEDILPYNIGKPNTGIGNIEENKNIIHPATKEQRDTFFAKMKEAGYEWDAEKKELKKIEHPECSKDNLSDFESYLCLMFQKFRTKGICTNGEIIDFVEEHVQKLKNTLCHAWSEEDERNLNDAILFIETGTYSLDKDNLINWLKSLKDRYTWKPSDEQMKILNEVLNFAANHESSHWNDYIFGTLNNLIRQLKKLKS